MHVKWDGCPAKQFFEHKGKEGYPTLVWEAVVDRSLRFRSVSGACKGAWNDKGVSWYDRVVQRLHTRQLFANAEFELFTDAAGSVVKLQGAYLMCDGGYNWWRVLQRTLKDHPNVDVSRGSGVNPKTWAPTPNRIRGQDQQGLELWREGNEGLDA